MKISSIALEISLLVFCINVLGACQERVKSKGDDSELISQIPFTERSQIAEYVVSSFEDSQGDLWFGTLQKGVAMYDGNSLKYFTTDDGLTSNRVTVCKEDRDGCLWFGTGAGISKYDGKDFINYDVEDGLCNNMISNLLIDSKGGLWIGTWGGVCRFDGKNFSTFDVPKPKISSRINPDTENWITEIMEDSNGNIWIGRDGYGASRYDGKTFRHFLKKDGLYSNNVQGITEDKEGNIWFASRVAEKDDPDPSKRFGEGGVVKYDGSGFIYFPELKGLSENDVYTIYKDKSDNLWISTLGDGVYRYDGQDFINYECSQAVMSFLEDKDGTIWIGCAGGLYRIESDVLVNVTTKGPWK